MPVVLDDHMHHAVEQSNVGSQALVNGEIGKLSELDIPGIGNDQLGPVLLCLDDPVGDQGMACGGVGPDDKDNFGVGFKLGNGVCHGSASKSSGKTCHC